MLWYIELDCDALDCKKSCLERESSPFYDKSRRNESMSPVIPFPALRSAFDKLNHYWLGKNISNLAGDET